MKLKFFGTLGELTKLIRKQGIVCELTLTRSRHVQYRTADGGVINWWPTTGTVFLQGDDDEKVTVYDRLKTVLSPYKPKDDCWDDDDDEDYDLEE